MYNVKGHRIIDIVKYYLHLFALKFCRNISVIKNIAATDSDYTYIRLTLSGPALFWYNKDWEGMD